MPEKALVTPDGGPQASRIKAQGGKPPSIGHTSRQGVRTAGANRSRALRLWAGLTCGPLPSCLGS